MPAVITTAAELASLEFEWNALAGDASLFASHAFATHWYRCFASPDAVRVFRVEDNGETIGFLPMVLDGGMLKSLTNLHCMHSTPPVKRGAESRFGAAAARTLAESKVWNVATHEYAYGFL